MRVFNLYAAYYDLLYRDKDYAGETDYLVGLIHAIIPGARSVLELGCGTGGHAVQFAERGFSVHGIDLSPDMIERAVHRRELLAPELKSLLTFEQGDVRRLRLARTFDAVVSLFHVMSYQATNVDQEAAFATARTHLTAGGLFVFDFWYGPAVLSDRPRRVIKHAADNHIEIRRETIPAMRVNENCVDVHFEIEIASRGDGRSQRITEEHRMRYLFLPEIVQRLGATKFELLSALAWMSHRVLDDQSWYGCVVARAR